MWIYENLLFAARSRTDHRHIFDSGINSANNGHVSIDLKRSVRIPVGYLIYCCYNPSEKWEYKKGGVEEIQSKLDYFDLKRKRHPRKLFDSRPMSYVDKHLIWNDLQLLNIRFAIIGLNSQDIWFTNRRGRCFSFGKTISVSDTFPWYKIVYVYSTIYSHPEADNWSATRKTDSH